MGVGGCDVRIIGVRVKTRGFKPTLSMSMPDITAFLELAIRQALNMGLSRGSGHLRTREFLL
jgi:hypothetical protein